MDEQPEEDLCLAKCIKFTTDFTKCMKCQTNMSSKLSTGTKEGLAKFIDATLIRKDEIHHHLKTKFDKIQDGSITTKWHNNWYEAYTSKHNLQLLTININLQRPSTEHRSTENDQQEEHCRRSSVQPVHWSKCVFCEKYKHKGNTSLSQILTYTAEHNLKEATKVRSDIQMRCKINGVDLIAQEVKYHPSCFSAYTSKRNLDKFGRDDNDSKSGYTEAFSELIQKVDVDILHLKKVFDMGTLLTMYKTLLQRRNLPFETYRTEKLKRQLVNHYGDKIVFQVPFDRTKPELIYNRDISVSDAISAVASAKTLPNIQVLGCSSLSKSAIIVHAASVI